MNGTPPAEPGVYRKSQKAFILLFLEYRIEKIPLTAL
jgi:hypothetical protein